MDTNVLLQNPNNVASGIRRNSYTRALDTVDNYIFHTGVAIDAKTSQDIVFYTYVITVFK
jgi:hypothetical protein